ncbi:hypothetical protein D7Y15_21560 [Corallococcus sp. AB030]|uniref:hypothetical protein n=1 Tax=Corallococcus TaxID=83461 RepID=UPI000EE15A7E|nr:MULTISPECIES: hypothetical protein [Corallococcus]NRD56409.1 hypothetical protein [Corallococcus exiguus]RKI10701.1 hypothetical protein D7Y15_21560 [Corallococcus sp. AB030]
MSPSFSLSAKDAETVLDTFDREGLIEALLLVRQCLDVDLFDIGNAVEPLLRNAGRLASLPEAKVEAQVIATGVFRRELADHMDYGAERNTDTREGTRVIASFFVGGMGAFHAEVLARCMGAEAWDFNTHALVPERMRVQDLAHLWMDDGLLTRFHTLRDAGFRFYFRMPTWGSTP